MITETLNNLLHQTAFFNLDWQLRYDRSGLLLLVSCD